jgi:hypothetical protein
LRYRCLASRPAKEEREKIGREAEESGETERGEWEDPQVTRLAPGPDAMKEIDFGRKLWNSQLSAFFLAKSQLSAV